MNHLNIKGRLTKVQRCLNAHGGQKPNTVRITDETEIAAIARDTAKDIVGWRDSGGHYYAYADTVRKFRRRLLRSREEAK